MSTYKKQFIFQQKNNLFSIPLDIVIEVEESPKLTQPPWSEKALVGLLNYKGLPIPVLEPSLFISNPEKNKKFESNSSVVITEVQNFKIAYLQDKFYKIIPALDLNENQESEHFLSGMTMLDNKPLLVLNVNFLLNHFRNIFQNQFSLEVKQKSIVKEGTNVDCIKFLSFVIDNVDFCVPIEEVLEVVENLEVTLLFNTPPLFRGLLNLRGKIIPALDISVFLDLPLRQLTENTKYLILFHNSVEIAICVDMIYKMREWKHSQVISPEGILSGTIAKYSKGIIKSDQKTILVLSTIDLIYSDILESFTRMESI